MVYREVYVKFMRFIEIHMVAPKHHRYPDRKLLLWSDYLVINNDILIIIAMHGVVKC